MKASENATHRWWIVDRLDRIVRHFEDGEWHVTPPGRDFLR